MCTCIDDAEKQLLESGRNTKLDIPITFSLTGKGLSANRVTVSTCKRDDKKREKPLRMFAAFCPFCGQAYESDDAREQRVQLTDGGLPASDKESAPAAICN